MLVTTDVKEQDHRFDCQNSGIYAGLKCEPVVSHYVHVAVNMLVPLALDKSNV